MNPCEGAAEELVFDDDSRDGHLTSDGAGIRLWDGDLPKYFGVVLLCNLRVENRL